MLFNITRYIFLLLPITIITGPFLTNLSVSIIGFFYVFKGNKKLLFNKISLFFIFFYFFFIFSSLVSEYTYLSLKNSLFLFRLCSHVITLNLKLLKSKFFKISNSLPSVSIER